MIRTSFAVCVAALAMWSGAAAWAEQGSVAVVRIAVLSQLVEQPPALSNLEVLPDDSGLLGARMAITENNTTGRFMKQRFDLREKIVPVAGDVVAELVQKPDIDVRQGIQNRAHIPVEIDAALICEGQRAADRPARQLQQ